MKLPAICSVIAIGLTAFVAAMPAANDDTSINTAFSVLEARERCSGLHAQHEKCSGKRLGSQTKLHNWYAAPQRRTINHQVSCSLSADHTLYTTSKNRDGKSCARNKDGGGCLDVSKG